MNNLPVYTGQSGPRCVSVQFQGGMSQLAVAADRSPQVQPQLRLLVPNQLLPPI